MRKEAAFTVFELLVSLGIIIVLTAFLMPVVSSVRFSGLEAKCAAHLRVIALAGRLFAQDHQGEFTDTSYFNSRNDADGKRGFREYVEFQKKVSGIDTIFTCPVLQKLYPTKGFAYNHNYAVNREATTLGTLKRWQNVESLASMSYFTEGVPTGQDARGYYFSTSYIRGDLNSLVLPHRGHQMIIYLDGHVARIGHDDLASYPENSLFWKGRAEEVEE